MQLQPIYKRVVIKISGEALGESQGMGINFKTVQKTAQHIKEICNLGVEVVVVIGGGNIWRGRQGKDMDRVTADHMGMLATVINSLAMQDALEQLDIPTRVQTAIEMRQIAEPYIRRRAVRHLEKGRVVIFACGTGNPYFSTDTTAALRAAEVEAQAILLAKNIDAVYDKDPKAHPDAKRLETISYIDVINRSLQVMDTTAITLCMENHIPIIVFGLADENTILRAVCGENTGTIIS